MNENAKASFKNLPFYPGGQINRFTSQEMIGWLVGGLRMVKVGGRLLFWNRPAKWESPGFELE